MAVVPGRGSGVTPRDITVSQEEIAEKLKHYLLTARHVNSDGSPVDGVALDAILRDRLEHFSGFNDHDTPFDPLNPFPHVTMNPASDVIYLHPTRFESARLMRYQVPKTTNMSVNDLLNLDTVTYAMIVESAIETYKEDLERKAGALADLPDPLE